jgi:hypothetical protein
MTNDTGRRVLPLTPHPDHLRKEAKARLAELKTRIPSARLADVQFTLAREYGFANWAALQAEVIRRAGAPRLRFRRLYIAGISPTRFWDADDYSETQAAFFRAGVITQIGFLFTTLVGVSMLFVTQHQLRVVHAVFEQLAQLTRSIL